MAGVAFNIGITTDLMFHELSKAAADMRTAKRSWQRFYTLLRREDGRRAHDAGPVRLNGWRRGWSEAAQARFAWDEVKRARREVRRMVDGWASR